MVSSVHIVSQKKKAKKFGRHGDSLYVSEKRGFHNGDKKATNAPVGPK